ncbi:cytochrome c peroxidase [Hyphomicrobium sp. 99]|uniref:cytochrome c peroxidase n=1 Tax=Hyphomicrobium sp. 99 TaxID=1163419 RepID=UPI0009E3CE2C|nr:cytochrome c peroxidase [Hyphomicrobium sp. 99]
MNIFKQNPSFVALAAATLAVGFAAVCVEETFSARPLSAATAYEDSLAKLKAKYVRPDAPAFPETNPYSEAKAKLGKDLFFDPRLSSTGSVSCASCHNPAFRWSDGLAKGRGVTGQELPRRSPSIVNSAWLTTLMWDGRADTLEQQAALPMTAEHEMGMTPDAIVERVKSISGYRPLFESAFPAKDIDFASITAAIATYERTLISNEAPFDHWIAGNEGAITAEAKRGFALFNGAAGCSKCHGGWRFTDDSFHDIGLKSADIGRGQFAPPSVVGMQHAFKTPSLRDLNIHGPYMHDGSMTSLVDVIRHYENGGEKRPSLSTDMKQFTLTQQERTELEAFVKTLSASPLTTELPVLP